MAGGETEGTLKLRVWGEAAGSGRGEPGEGTGRIRCGSLLEGGQGEPFVEDAECRAQFRGSMKSSNLESAKVGGEACSQPGDGAGGAEAATCQPPPDPALVGGRYIERGLVQGARGVGPGFLGKSPPSTGIGLSGCPFPARSGGLGPRSPSGSGNCWLPRRKSCL